VADNLKKKNNAIEEKKRQIVKHGEELRMKLVLHKLEQNLRLEARNKAFEKLKETMDNLDINSPDFNEKNDWISGELKRLNCFTNVRVCS
jgi:hypothetical protein